MRPVLIFSLAVLGFTQNALAADYSEDTPYLRGSEVYAPPAPKAYTRWSGFYAGVYGVGQASPAGGTQYGLGLDVGVNAQFEFVLVGAEVAVHGLTGGAGSTTYVEALGRVGVPVADNFLLYAAAGVGVDAGPPAESDALFGAGVEYALSDDVSLRAQYLHGFPLTGANPKDQVTLGANFHF